MWHILININTKLFNNNNTMAAATKLQDDINNIPLADDDPHGKWSQN